MTVPSTEMCQQQQSTVSLSKKQIWMLSIDCQSNGECHSTPWSATSSTLLERKIPLHTQTTYLKGMALAEVDTAPCTYLGINIMNDLIWHTQVSGAASKGNRDLGFVKRNININSSSTKERGFKILVRAALKYAYTIGDPHKKSWSTTLRKPSERQQDMSHTATTQLQVWPPCWTSSSGRL